MASDTNHYTNSYHLSFTHNRVDLIKFLLRSPNGKVKKDRICGFLFKLPLKHIKTSLLREFFNINQPFSIVNMKQTYSYATTVSPTIKDMY